MFLCLFSAACDDDHAICAHYVIQTFLCAQLKNTALAFTRLSMSVSSVEHLNPLVAGHTHTHTRAEYLLHPGVELQEAARP